MLPGGSVIGLEIIRSLARSRLFELIGAAHEDDHSRFAVDEIHRIPPVSHPAFLDTVNDLAASARVDVIFPANDDVGLAFAHAQESGQLVTPALTSDPTTHEITRSKRSTYVHLHGDVPVPAEVSDTTSPPIFPLFAKPDRGRMSIGTFRVDTPAELAVARQRNLLVTEYLPGPEYTVDCFTDRTGELRFARGRTRERIFGGISARSRWVVDDRMPAMARAINGRLSLRGGWFFQVKERRDGELVLMEVAPRIAGTMGLSRAIGVNLPLLTLLDHFDADVEIPPLVPVTEVDRALESSFRTDLTYDRVYMGLADLVLVDDSVDLTAIRFIFQCRNRGIAVHLITRHAGDLAATLRKHGLADLFASIRQIAPTEPKWPHVPPGAAVFIDASIPDRRAVTQHRGVPAFDPQNLEALIDHRR